MKRLLNLVFQTVTFRQSSTTFSATLLNGFLGAIFYIVIARALGPSDFGILTVAIIVLTLMADIADIGTNTGLTRFVSANISTNKEKAYQFLKLALEIKLVVWLIVLWIGFLISPQVAEKIFHKTELIVPLRLAIVGVGGALLFSFSTSSLQSMQKYKSWGAINIVTNLLRLIVILALLFYQRLNLFSGLSTFIFLPFFGFFLSLFLLPSRQVYKVKNEWTVSKTFFHYNIWVAFFTVIAAVSARLDTFLNASLLSSKQVGIYGAANQLTAVVPQLISALGVVAAPKFAGFENKKQMLIYLKKFQLLVFAIAVVGCLAIPASFYFIPLFYGQAYNGAILPFIILLVAQLVFLISIPIHNSIIFFFSRPQVFVWVSFGHLFIIAGLGYLLIASFGVLGTALTVLVGATFNFIVPLIWFLKKVRS